MMGVYFMQHDFGCNLEEARNINAATAATRRDIGSLGGTIRARKATRDDVSWVYSMGGYVPQAARHLIEQTEHKRAT